MIEVAYRSPSDRLPSSNRSYRVVSQRVIDAPMRVFLLELAEGRTIQFVCAYLSRGAAIAHGKRWEASHG